MQGSNNDKSTAETIEHIQIENNDFNIKATSVGQINKIIKGLKAKKATGPDNVPVKIVKLAASVIDSRLTNIINDLSDNAFSDSASVRPIYKKDVRNEITNYGPAGIFNCFSKIYEQFLNEQLLPSVNRSISELMPAHRSGYCANVLIRLIENWRHALDNLFTGAVLMDLSKAITVSLTIS